MPTYAFRCQRCGTRFDAFLAVSRRHEAACPSCGATGGALAQLPAWQGAILSGGGAEEPSCGEGSCAACPAGGETCEPDWD